MKLFLLMPNGTRLPLDGPFEVQAFDDGPPAPAIQQPPDFHAPVLKHTVTIAVEHGANAYARASGGSASIATTTAGYTLKVDIKRAP
jgi:hypothetical protein